MDGGGLSDRVIGYAAEKGAEPYRLTRGDGHDRRPAGLHLERGEASADDVLPVDTVLAVDPVALGGESKVRDGTSNRYCSTDRLAHLDFGRDETRARALDDKWRHRIHVVVPKDQC